MIEALILAGGFGTRLRPKVADRPKALAPIAGRPFLARQIDWLAAQGVTSVALAVHYLADQIIEFAHAIDGRPLPVRIVREEEPLGTGGAVANALRALDTREDILVVNGDTQFDFTLPPILDWHHRRRSILTMVVAGVEDASRFGTVLLDGDRVTGFVQATGARAPALVNGGAYLLNPAAMADAPAGAFSIERDWFPRLAERGLLHGYRLPAGQGFFDFGTPEAFDAFRARCAAETPA